MRAVRLAKSALKETFPAMWLEWHFLRRPRTAEIELNYIRRLVPKGAITIDVGANCGLYTRELARCSSHVHAFEPARQMAELLRRTSSSNVTVHELAASDHEGVATLSVPVDGDQAVHSLASIEQRADAKLCATEQVRTARLDSLVKDEVAFIKIDVEGHELSVLHGATGLIERSRPIFLVEAEERHHERTTASLFEFFVERKYEGLFVMDGEALSVSEFDPQTMQDPATLLPNGGRREGQHYINNFFFFPEPMDGRTALLA